MKDVEISLNSTHIKPNEQILGNIKVNYTGRYDGIVINTHILDSNGLLEYGMCNGKNVDKNVTRLFIPKDSMKNNTAEFTAFIRFEPEKKYAVKFRVSIIEQHKEIESDHIFAELFCYHFHPRIHSGIPHDPFSKIPPDHSSLKV